MLEIIVREKSPDGTQVQKAADSDWNRYFENVIPVFNLRSESCLLAACFSIACSFSLAAWII